MRVTAWIRVVILLSAAGVAASAHADGVTLNRFSPPETIDDGLTVSRPDDRGHLRPGVQLHFDYSNDPLVFERRSGSMESETVAVVSDQLVANLGVSLGLWNRVVVFAGLAANLVMQGEDLRDPADGQIIEFADGPGLGNARVGARVRLLGAPEDLFGLGLQLTAILPTAEAADGEQRFAGEAAASVLPELLMELRPGTLRLTINVGAFVRKDAQLIGASVKDQLSLAFAVTLPLFDARLHAHAEIFGATSLSDPGEREGSPVEVLLGGKYFVIANVWALGLGAGAGLQRGLGAPDFRLLATTRWEPQPEPKAEAGYSPVVLDSDGDGLVDRDDRCPREPEDKDSFEDEDGCPDPDNDKDGVLDASDQCGLEPEDTDGFADGDGCPDPDNDNDGLADGSDRCPLEPEDRDAFEDEDGCPDPDNDRDGVLDADDECPTAPGLAAAKGCPKAVRVEEGRILILERVEFGVNKDVILPPSEPVLAEVRAVIEVNPQIKRVRVEGHTDSQGKDTANMDLSRRRAASVKRWLSQRGIDPARLEAYGCGENLAIDDNGTKPGRQTNRRVEFHIAEPAPRDGPRAPAGCERQE